MGRLTITSFFAFLPVLLAGAEPAKMQPATAPKAAKATPQPATQRAIPLVYASKDGKPFPDIPARELDRIQQRAEDMTPPGKAIWFILVRSGSWFPAAEVYCRPQKVNGRVCSGQYSIVWREDSERAIQKIHQGQRWNDYVWVVPPGAAVLKVEASQGPPVPDTRWLPFRRTLKDDKLILSLVDVVQAYRDNDKENALPDAHTPIMSIELDGDNYNVLVAWPDQGYEEFCIVKSTPKGFEAIGWNLIAH